MYIVAGDVKSLYPSISRSLVEKALTFALTYHSFFTQAVFDILVNLAMFCLHNVIIQHKQNFYTQKTGIITGDNHSVSLANITLHYVILPISDVLKKSILFKRFIDDIIWLSLGVETTLQIKNCLLKTFQDNNLDLTFRMINTADSGSTLEFLDVEHKIDSSYSCGFFTKNFIKPTATNRLFLNSQSYHPPHVFKSTVYSEAVRMRRLNESTDEYLNILQQLKTKCLKSNFNLSLVNKILKIATTWQSRFSPDSTTSSQQVKSKKLVWATPFTKFLSFDKTEKKLIPSASVIYKNPPTFRQTLTNYPYIAHNTTKDDNHSGISQPCNKCSLCGKHGNNPNMVISTGFITSENNKKIFLTQRLTCDNYGIYAAQCKLCHQIYVEQTKNKFSVRWTNHRTFWKNNNTQNHTDKAALLLHFHNHHKNFISSHPDISECYHVIFLQEPRYYHNLDISESKWIRKLKATININKTLLPNFFDPPPFFMPLFGYYFFILHYKFIVMVSSSI